MKEIILLFFEIENIIPIYTFLKFIKSVIHDFLNNIQYIFKIPLLIYHFVNFFFIRFKVFKYFFSNKF